MSAGGGGGEGDVELNIAPIVDCFTVLIAYMLVSMSFIQLSIFEAEVAASAPPDVASAPPPPPASDKVPLSFTVELVDGNRVELKVSGGSPAVKENISVEALNGEVNGVELAKQVDALKKAHPDLVEASITASPAIRYRSIIKVIQAVKSVLPKVLMASG
jgi:biopolymer transport protein ExbD